MQKITAVFQTIFLTCLFALLAVPAMAENASPVGYWQTSDPTTHQPNSIVHIWQNAGVLQGKVVKLYTNPNAVCSQCSGNLHNKAVQGMTVLWGFTQRGNVWADGKILAVRRGVVFPASLALTNNGQQLSIRVKAFGGGHTQTWSRVNAPAGM